MAIKRPKRRNYASDVAWHEACMRYLDAKWPGREGQRKRVAAWARWEREHNVEIVRARISELIASDDWTALEAAEFSRLAEAWKARTATRKEAHRGN